MSTFTASYARYYDLLYRDKDYAREADFVMSRLPRQPGPQAHLLELGCGTGLHALELAARGIDVTGIDLSEHMVRLARERAARVDGHAPRPAFEQGDVRSVRLGRKFDIVVSLFHVMSYQVSDSDLRQAFATAAAHLKPGGAFIFDCWYGPAVLSEAPSVRVKRMEDERIQVVRLAEPVVHSGENVVDVNYTVWITDRSCGAIEVVREVHAMRYLFLPEIRSMLNAAGLELRQACEWLSGKELDCSTWSATVVAGAAA